METINTLLLAVLFLAGLLNFFIYYLPTKKFYAYLQSRFLPKDKKATHTTQKAIPISTTHPPLMTSKRQGELKQVFGTFDRDKDGYVTKQELMESLNNIRISMTEKEVGELVEKVDANGDGLIDFEEFCLLFRIVMGEERERGGDGESEWGQGNDEEEREEEMKEAFGVFDRDKDGLITVDELGMVLSSLGLKEGRKKEDCKEMIRKVDMDGDGMVNFDEFKRMMKAGGARLIFAS